MAEVSEIYVKRYRSGAVQNDWTKLGTVTGVVAGYMSSNNYVAVFRFELPNPVNKMVFSVCCNSDNTNSSHTLRYKVVSGAEDSSMANANNSTACDGTWTPSSTANFGRSSLTINKVVPAGTTYLYLWTNKASGTANSYGMRCYPVGNTYETTLEYTNATTYTISYNANGYGAAPASQTKIQGLSLVLQPFIANQTTTGYTVSFNANGGSSTPSAITSTITKGQTSWNTASNGTGSSYGSGVSYTADAAVTMYAIWGSSTNNAVTLPAAISRASGTDNYTISYNANGGSSTPSNQTLTRTTPYTFASWNGYGAGASYTPTAATTLTAQWNTGTTTGSVTLASAISRGNSTENGYTVTFNANGGSCSTSNLTATNTRSYTFAGWNTNANGAGTNYSAGASYSSSANLSLHAKWNSSISNYGAIALPTASKSSTSSSCTITYNANGGSCSTASATSTRTTSYTFKGWSTSSSATSGSTGSYSPTGNVTLYATWSSSTGAYSAVTLPTPTRSGYTFKGWATSTGATSGSTGSYTPTGSVTLYAIWESSGGIYIYSSGSYKTA